jgi:alpha-mannosidase
MWVESDGMLPTGESLSRQISFDKRYFASRFGVEPRGVWLPDSFGYTGAWPQIARRSGYDWFLTQKISWNDTTKVPHHSFMWEGIDGSRIFTHFPPSDTYAASVTAQELTYAEHNFKDKDIADRSLMLFGYGDGGGGPTREMLGRVHRFRNLEGVSRVAIDTPNHFFEQARHQLEANAGLEIPVWHGELYLELHRGTLTSQQEMKRGCRQEESLLRTTEYICAVAVLSCDDYKYPQGALDDIWKTLLLNQFHDVLPGSSIAWVHKEARTQYRRDIQRLKDIIAEAGDAIGSANTNVAILPKAKLRQYRLDGGAWCFDEVGTAVASGAVESRTPSDTAMRNAQDTSIEFGVQIKHLDDGRISLRNQYMEVTIESDGAISSLVDIHVGRELIVPGTRLGRYELLTDEPSVYDAWDIERDALLRVKDITNGEITGITQDDQGVSVESRTIHNDTTIVTTIRLASNSRQLDFHTHVDWHERERFLKVDVPLSITAQHAQYDCQYGIVERPVIRNTASDEAQFESCTNRFMRLHDSSYAVSVVNGSIYGSDIGPIRETSESMNSGALEGTMFRLSLLESPIFPDPREDVGEHDFSWAVVTDASIERTLDSACAINAPQIADVPAIEPLVYLCKTQGVPVIDWIKLADDGSGELIVRIYEAAGGNARATIHLAELMKDASIRETNLLERPDIHDDLPHALEPVKSRGQTTTASDDVQPAEGSHISLKPFQLSTLRLSRG